MENSFSLLRLPENVIVQVLRNTGPEELLIISLVSSKTKRLVKSLGLRVLNLYIHVFQEIALYLNFGASGWNLIFCNGPNDQNAEIDITRPVSASYVFLNKPFQPSTPFNFSDWLDHIRTVFCHTDPLDVDFGPGSERFGMESLKNTLKNVNSITIIEGVTDIQTTKISKSFEYLNKLTLDRNPFEDICEVQKLFIQNYKIIVFNDVYSLDDMLSVNSETVYFWRPTTQKQFNRFVKHWIRGSNPRLQCMYLSINDSDSVSKEVLLKGFQCVDVAEEMQQEICRKHGIVSDYMVEIRRKDGTPAVIATNEYENILYISFFVYY